MIFALIAFLDYFYFDNNVLLGPSNIYFIFIYPLTPITIAQTAFSISLIVVEYRIGAICGFKDNLAVRFSPPPAFFPLV